jgi:hypothetical protein
MHLRCEGGAAAPANNSMAEQREETAHALRVDDDVMHAAGAPLGTLV